MRVRQSGDRFQMLRARRQGYGGKGQLEGVMTKRLRSRMKKYRGANFQHSAKVEIHTSISNVNMRNFQSLINTSSLSLAPGEEKIFIERQMISHCITVKSTLVMQVGCEPVFKIPNPSP